MRVLLAVLACLPMALAAVPSANAALCEDPSTGPSQYGLDCNLQTGGEPCSSYMWGYHGGFLTVGGSSSCNVEVMLRPSEPVEDPLGPYRDDICGVVDGVC